MSNVESGYSKTLRRMALHSMTRPPEGVTITRKAIQRNSNSVPDKGYTTAEAVTIGLAGASTITAVGTLIYAMAASRPSSSVLRPEIAFAGVELLAALSTGAYSLGRRRR